MARLQRGFSPGRGRSLRRKTAWSVGTGGTTVLTLSSSSTAFVGQSLQPNVEGLTVVRLRGYLRAVLTAVAGANDGFSGAFGIGIASTPAVVAGVGSVPTPITEQDAENWLYWRALSLQSMTATIADGVNAVSCMLDYEIDSKAMRKFPDETSLYAIIEVIENGTSVMDVWHDSRMLFKLP